MSTLPAMTYEAYKALTQDQKDALLDEACKGKHSHSELKRPVWAAPNWLPTLYLNSPFPCTAKPGFRAAVDEDNIYCGAMQVLGDDVDMRWINCASQLIDGQLHLGCLSAESTIRGKVGSQYEFAFLGGRLQSGKWPGFLVVHYA
jgi:hypothetical protein